MPIYEFKCNSCDKRFELLISMSRLGEAECPSCASGEIKRLMSTFAAHTGSSSSHSSGCAGCASGQCGSCNCGH